MLNNFEELLELVLVRGGEAYQNGYTAWALFYAVPEEINLGCDDDNLQSRTAHAERVRVLAEEFLQAGLT
jgi:hypothetical protein